MAQDISSVLQEISDLLRQLSEQSEPPFRRQEEFEPGAESESDWRKTEARREQVQAQTESFCEKGAEGASRPMEDRALRDRLIRTLEQQDKLLEALIARIKERPS